MSWPWPRACAWGPTIWLSLPTRSVKRSCARCTSGGASTPGAIVAPQKTTFTRLLAAVDAAVLEAVLLAWQKRLTGPIQDTLVIVDGKKLRHGGVEMVNATNGAGQFLGGVITAAKRNEIPAARQRLGRLDVAGKIVLGDALHTQVQTAQQILYEQGGDCLLTVKANQPTLPTTLQHLFARQVLSPSSQSAQPRAAPPAPPGPTGNSLPAMPGSHAQPSGIPGRAPGGSAGNPSQSRRQMEPRSGLSLVAFCLGSDRNNSLTARRITPVSDFTAMATALR